SNDTYTLLASSPTFTVTNTGANNPSVTASAGNYALGQTIPIAYTNMPGNQTDWVSLAVQGSPATSFVEYRYTYGSTNGSFNFPGVTPPGTYVARAYFNNSYTISATSAPFTVP